MSYTKPGSGGTVVSTIVGGEGIHVDSLVPSNPVVSVDDSELNAVLSIVAGTAITVDNTDPQNPIVSSSSLGLESIQPGANISVDSTDALNPIISSVGGSGSAVVVDTIGAMEGYVGAEQVIFVRDQYRGGLFTKTNAVLTADGGVTFAASGGGFWIRHFDRHTGVSVKWFGAVGDKIADDILAFEATERYITDLSDVFEDTLADRPKIVIPDGMYRLTRTWKMGGAPISPSDAQWYQAYTGSAPSYIFTEHQLAAGYLAVSIEFGQRAYIIPDFGPLTELTAVISMSAYSYAFGTRIQQSCVIDGMKITSRYDGGGALQNFGADGPNLAGFVIYGAIPGIEVKNCTFSGLQVGFIANTMYMSNLSQFAFNSCGTGFCFVGGHGATGWMFTSYNCELAYKIFSGASAWTQLNTEQCAEALWFDGNETVFNGIYFEQLNDYSDTHPDAWQIRIGDDSGPPSGNKMGIEINAAVLTNVPFGKEIRIGTTTQDISIMNISAYGQKFIAHADTKVTTNAYEPNFSGPGLPNLTRIYGGEISTKLLKLTGHLTGTSADFQGATNSWSLSTGDLSATGVVQLPSDIKFGTTFKRKRFPIIDNSGSFFILGKTINDGQRIQGKLQFQGVTLGEMDIEYAWGLDPVLRWILKHEMLPYLFGVPTIYIYSFVFDGIGYYGFGFEGAFGSYLPTEFTFNGNYVEFDYAFQEVPRAACTSIVVLENAQLNTGVQMGPAAPTTIPLKAGFFYLDTTNKKLYVSTGRDTSADWTILN